MKKHKVLIVGGGFGGLKAALELSKHEQFSVTLLSNSVQFHYYPTFYHTATGGLREQSYIPIKELLGDAPVRFVLGTAKTVDRAKRLILTGDSRRFAYDTLILSLGSTTNYFGIKGLDKYSFGIKSPEEIKRFKKHLHDQLTDEREPETNYVVIGAGATGLELAGALPEYIRIIRKNHQLPRRKLHIDLLEAGPRLLPRANKATARAVRKRLRKLGVKLYLKTVVQGQTADGLVVNGKPLRSHTVVWTAGVANSPFFKANGFALDNRGKVVVDEYLRAEPHIFVIGDNNNAMYSGMAQTALLHADNVSHNMVRLFNGAEPKPNKPQLPVTVIPVGKDWAAVDWGKIHFAGKGGYMLRSAADWIGYNDLQPWWEATEQWFTEFGRFEDCPTCSVAAMNHPDRFTDH